MNIGAYISVFFLSTFKFLFAPLSGPAFGLSFLETFLLCSAGGTLSAVIFYFSADLLQKRSKRKLAERKKKALEQGLQWVNKRKFTFTNRLIIKVKRTVGIVGISFWVPLLLSIPIGSMIVAKFYGNEKKTFPLIVLGVFVNSFILSALVYFIF
ncbi:MAG: hypothetical protein EP305_01110 [Bacteroidetes bacterium]|nr:MAG: hypothetical protein EP305_01110 [Bacteroidota bacterium]